MDAKVNFSNDFINEFETILDFKDVNKPYHVYKFLKFFMV